MQKYSVFAGRYRAPTHRRKAWNYATSANYLVTICTQSRYPWFGDIQKGVMGLSESGCVVADEVQKTNIIRPNVNIDYWIVMPDHVHLMISIHDNPYDLMLCVDTHRRCVSTAIQSIIPFWCRRAGELGSIIAQLKPAITKRIRVNRPEFKWQNNYHDRIIRNKCEYWRTVKYIQNNPRRCHDSV